LTNSLLVRLALLVVPLSVFEIVFSRIRSYAFGRGLADFRDVLAQAVGVLIIALVVEAAFQSATRRRLRRLNQQLGQAQEIGKIGSWELDMETNQFVPSHQLKSLLAPVEVRAASLSDFIESCVHRDDRDAFRTWIANARQAKIVSADYRIGTPHEDYRVLHLRGAAICDTRGQVTRLIGTMQDVTDQRRMEQRLQETIQRIHSIIERNTMGICEFDLEGNFLDVNPAYEALTGYTRAELMGKPRIMLWRKEDYDLAARLLQQACEGKLVSSAQITLLHKSGVEIPVATTNVPILIDGKPAGFYSMVRDLREELAAEELVRQSEKLAIAGQLAASVAHEIRNPLTAIKGFMQLMPVVDGQTMIRYKQIIDQELASVERISSELLMLAKPQADDWGFFKLEKILQDTVVLMEPQALMQSVVLSLNVSAGTYPIYCIEGQLKQVFINLVKNALEATPDGGSVCVHLDSSGENYIVCIDDTGRGIPADVLPRLGEPFYTTKHEGTGLGLMVCHRIIDRHGGLIQYRSSSDGTSVTITLSKSFDVSAGPRRVPLSVSFGGPSGDFGGPSGDDNEPFEPYSTPAL
jgi:two-component system, sporulation sensor kinase A